MLSKLLGRHLSLANIALFDEVPIEHPDLPRVGAISGSLDYLASAMDVPTDLAVGFAIPENPRFIIVEAKRSQTLSEVQSEAQLLAQLLTLEYTDPY
jgi:hypothetical protein